MAFYQRFRQYRITIKRLNVSEHHVMAKSMLQVSIRDHDNEAECFLASSLKYRITIKRLNVS
jgi:hypothetical protein